MVLFIYRKFFCSVKHLQNTPYYSLKNPFFKKIPSKSPLFSKNLLKNTPYSKKYPPGVDPLGGFFTPPGKRGFWVPPKHPKKNKKTPIFKKKKSKKKAAQPNNVVLRKAAKQMNYKNIFFYY